MVQNPFAFRGGLPYPSFIILQLLIHIGVHTVDHLWIKSSLSSSPVDLSEPQFIQCASNVRIVAQKFIGAIDQFQFFRILQGTFLFCQSLGVFNCIKQRSDRTCGRRTSDFNGGGKFAFQFGLRVEHDHPMLAPFFGQLYLLLGTKRRGQRLCGGVDPNITIGMSLPVDFQRVQLFLALFLGTCHHKHCIPLFVNHLWRPSRFSRKVFNGGQQRWRYHSLIVLHLQKS